MEELIVVSGTKPLGVSCPIRVLTEIQFKSISVNKTPQGLAGVIRLPEGWNSDMLPENPGDLILLLENIQDPGNVGTLMRTAAAFGFSGMILSDQCVDPFSPKSAQAAAGTMMSIWIRRTSSYMQLIKTLMSRKYDFIAMDMKGDQNIWELKRSEKLILALGNEGSGLSPDVMKLSTQQVRIHIDNRKAESLNVAVCGGIGMHHLALKK